MTQLDLQSKADGQQLGVPQTQALTLPASPEGRHRQPTATITRATLEACLDRLAQIITTGGDDEKAAILIFERIETEIQKVDRETLMLEKINNRFRQYSGQKVTQSG